MNFKKMISVILLLAAAACSQQANVNGEPPDGPKGGDSMIPRLAYYESCDPLLADLKKGVVSQIETTLDGYKFDKSIHCWDAIVPIDDGAMEADSGSDDAMAQAPANFTDTNVQEVGVDEADILKTDGTHLYLASKTGVQIFKVWPSQDFKELATYPLNDALDVAKLYLYSDKLVVLYESFDSEKNHFLTHLDIVDITNPQNPVIVSQKTMEGRLQNSRRVGGLVHLAFNTELRSDELEIVYPEIDMTLYAEACKGSTQAIETIDALVEKAKKESLDQLENVSLKNLLPRYGSLNQEATIDCTQVAYEQKSESDENVLLKASIKKLSPCEGDCGGGSNIGSVTGLLSLSIASPESHQLTLLTAGKNDYWNNYQVYASPEAFYLMRTDIDYSAVSDLMTGNIVASTILHRFQLSNVGRAYHAYTASGSVLGEVLNSFSMSEKEGVLRVASLQQSETQETAIYTLDATTSDLKQLGSLSGLGKNETLYGVRFIGDKGYVVTFKKIDPLFVINLAAPKNPTIEGELKMPGYSTYLHPLGSDHLIGLGKDADDQGNFAWFQGLKLAVFDVSQGDDPQIVDDEIIGSRGSTSFALEDHHAFTFDAQTGLLALPLELYTGTQGGSDVGNFQYSGVHLYQVTTQGIVNVGAIQLDDEQMGGSAWDNAGPRRVVLMGESSSPNQVAYVLGNENLYQVDLKDSLDVMASLPVDNVFELQEWWF